MTTVHPRIAFQGEPGAHSHIACREVYPELEAVPFATFDEGFAALAEGTVDLAMVPVENSTAGRVADIHRLLPDSELHIVGEHFLRVRHCLLAPPGASTATLLTAHSHPQALAQCRASLSKLGLRPVMSANTASAAREVAEANDPTRAAVASRLAAEIFALPVLRDDLEDRPDNVTRFVILSRQEIRATADLGPIMTTLVFRVRDQPAALLRALCSFARHGVSLTRMESCTVSGQFRPTRFLADVEGHPGERPVGEALEELGRHAGYRILGVYRAGPFRDRPGRADDRAEPAGNHRGKDAWP